MPHNPPPASKESEVVVMQRQTRRALDEIDKLESGMKDLLGDIKVSYDARTAAQLNRELADFVKGEVFGFAVEQASTETIQFAAHRVFSPYGTTARGVSVASLIAEFALLTTKIMAKMAEFAAREHEAAILERINRILLQEVLPRLPQAEAILIENQADHEEARRLRDEYENNLRQIRETYDQLRRRSRLLAPQEGR